MPLINPIYVDDLCAIVKNVVYSRLQGTFNVCGNEILSIKELCEIISQKLQVENMEFDFNGKEVQNILGKNEKIQQPLNNCINTKISEGIEKMIN